MGGFLSTGHARLSFDSYADASLYQELLLPRNPSSSQLRDKSRFQTISFNDHQVLLFLENTL
jgi:hypothetical protein